MGNNKIRLLIASLLILLAVVLFFVTRNDRVDFNTQVKPIFNKKCITCHGGVKRQADFSLLFRSEALAINKSGKPAIIPGDPDHSEMIRRLKLKDPEERMPYRHEPLSSEEIETLRKWIKEGAPWGDHWAYVSVKEVEPPKPPARFFGLIPAAKPAWVRNDIDYFIYDGLQKEKLQPAPEANRATLLRRVSMDLDGLPPSPSLARQFLAVDKNDSDKAYERLVDSLLASPHFGEKWATMWLDLARYADTKGYEKDGERPEIWRYRDWLIRAFNADKPYDAFLTEQLAGDLLPAHTDDQMIATGFHRNSLTNDEGGTDNEEFRTAAVLDRVNTTWQALMGTTFACVQCHSHPYDPFKHDEYYNFVAFFNDTRDEDTYSDYPLLREIHNDDSVKLAWLTEWMKKNGTAEQASQEAVFLKTWQPAINSTLADQFVNSALEDTKYLTFRDHASARMPNVDLEGSDQLIYRFNSKEGGAWTIHLDKIDGPMLKQIPVPIDSGKWEIQAVDLPATKGIHDLFFTYSHSRSGKTLKSGLQMDWLHFGKRLMGQHAASYAEAEKTYWELLRKNLPGIPVMMENPANMHRVAHVFERGNWLVKGKAVAPGVPHSLNPFPANAPNNRLGLAEWMTDKRNPLVSRTLVNRFWEQLFGTGLVETLEDMGTQGAAPTNRDLIDWLAWNLMNKDQWSMKKCLKEIVMSATYRQDSRVSNELLEKDPYNKLYARGPRVRLSAEEVRDQALVASGLLFDSLYGPPVKPWQPAGIWHSPYNGDQWNTSQGGDQYRRALYTFWKRSSPYPSMVAFDGASREVCTARRIRTNTPLQALVTLNDSAYLETSRHLAFRMMGTESGRQNGVNPGGMSGETASGRMSKEQVIGKGYELLMYKAIEPAKLAILGKLYDRAYAQFSTDEYKTCEMVGEPGKHDNPETAAYVVVAGALLNLDEVVTKN